ncbi:hypothetical protein SAMN06265361_101648 [Laceyella tengchongensis]|jgi:hypothetical protein|uniref:DUF3951 domain-containing protein n=1 Tax=Laceyella tengchongensis TaxID=574699 RepID=A0AA45WK82_9BACL|nr:hypothetical protein SAMN06265361_101648 [Laceyella tengchongensis]
MVLGFIVLGIVLMIAIALLIMPKLKKKQQPIDHDLYINQDHQLYAGAEVAYSIAHLPTGDSSTSN